MKKTLLSILGMAAAIFAFGQTNTLNNFDKTKMKRYTAESVSDNGSVVTQTDANFASTNRAGGGGASTAALDTIWFSDFSTASDWTINNDPNAPNSGWSLSSSTTGNTWFFQNTSVTSASGVPFAVLDPGDPNNPVPETHDLLTANAIDISAYTNTTLILSYVQYFAWFDGEFEIGVANNANGPYTVLDDNLHVPRLTAAGGQISDNPDVRNLIVPASMVTGQNDLFIRFRYINATGIDYGWFVDDVALLETPNNDLSIDTTYFYNSVLDTLSQFRYATQTARQAPLDTVRVVTMVTNKGATMQPNSKYTLDLTSPSSATGTSNTYGIAPSATQFIDWDSPVMLTSTQALHEFSLVVSSDSIDDLPDDNSVNFEIDVTDHKMALSEEGGAGFRVASPTGSYQFCILFSTHVVDTITGLSCQYSYSSTDPSINLQVGDPMSFFVYEANDLLANDIAGAIPVASQTFYSATAEDAMEDAEVIGRVTSNGNYAVLNPGDYYGCIETFATQTFMSHNGSSEDKVVDLLVLADGGDQTLGLWALIPNFNFYFTNNAECANQNVIINDTVVDNQEVGSINIGADGGVGPYLYSWTGPNGYTSNQQNIAGLVDQGTYTVKVQDLYGCVHTKDIQVAGIVSVEELNIAGNVSVYPNPNNGSFQITMEDVFAGTYELAIRNVIGQTVYNKVINVNGNHSEDVNLSDLNKGIYFIELSNDNGEKSVFKFVVK